MIVIDSVLSRSELIEQAPELANAVEADLTLPLILSDFLDLSSPSLLYFDADGIETVVFLVDWVIFVLGVLGTGILFVTLFNLAH